MNRFLTAKHRLPARGERDPSPVCCSQVKQQTVLGNNQGKGAPITLSSRSRNSNNTTTTKAPKLSTISLRLKEPTAKKFDILVFKCKRKSSTETSADEETAQKRHRCGNYSSRAQRSRRGAPRHGTPTPSSRPRHGAGSSDGYHSNTA